VTQRAIYIRRWRVDITVRDGVDPPILVPLPFSRLGRVSAAALDVVGAPSPASIGLILTNDVELAELNHVHMGVEGPTDVLSFPLLPPEAFPPHAGDPDRGRALRASAAVVFAGPPGRRPNLGDIVISVERATEQAAEGRGGQTGDVQWSAADELRLLVTHGTLHVCGWDHAEPAEEREMRVLEQRLLAADR
jgi:probable rRNA maturation factor